MNRRIILIVLQKKSKGILPVVVHAVVALFSKEINLNTKEITYNYLAFVFS